MIKARIRWCTCRVENILTLGKLLSLWFCFLLLSILFLISQTSFHTYKIISSYELARPVMGTIFLVVTLFWKNNRLARKTKLFFIALLPDRRCHRPNLKPIRHLRHASFSLFPLMSSCLNDDFCVYAIIYILSNQLVSPNTVTIYCT